MTAPETSTSAQAAKARALPPLHVAIILLGLVATAWTVSRGVTVGRDSVGYFEIASAMESGAPLPRAHWPPAYPALLAALGLLGLSQVAAATAINLASYAAAGLLGSAIALRLAGGRAALLLAWVMGSSVVLDAHLVALSEPLFLGVQLAACLLALNFLRAGSTTRIAGAAFAAGLSVWVRYAGVFLLPGLVLVPFLAARRLDRAAARQAAVAAVAGMLPVIALGLWLSTQADSGAVRTLAWHPPTAAQLAEGGRAFMSWWMPSSLANRIPWLGGLGAGALFAAPAIVAGLALRLGRRDAAALALQAALYLLGICLSISVADATTPLDVRVLLPCYVPLVLALGALAAAPWPSLSARRAGVTLLAAAALLAAARSGRYLAEYRAAAAAREPAPAVAAPSEAAP